MFSSRYGGARIRTFYLDLLSYISKIPKKFLKCIILTYHSSFDVGLSSTIICMLWKKRVNSTCFQLLYNLGLTIWLHQGIPFQPNVFCAFSSANFQLLDFKNPNVHHLWRNYNLPPKVIWNAHKMYE